MADYATPAIVTAPRESGFSLTTKGVGLRQGLSYVKQMKAKTTPVTAVAGGGSGGPRPTSGLIFPRGMG